MSKKYTECPMYDHNICKYLNAKEYCAIIREDKNCLKPNRGKMLKTHKK